MSNLDKLLTEFKDAEKKCSDSFGLNEIANYEYEAFSVNNSAKLIKIIEVMKEALKISKSCGRCEYCKRLAEDTLQQAEQIAGQNE